MEDHSRFTSSSVDKISVVVTAREVIIDLFLPAAYLGFAIWIASKLSRNCFNRPPWSSVAQPSSFGDQPEDSSLRGAQEQEVEAAMMRSVIPSSHTDSRRSLLKPDLSQALSLPVTATSELKVCNKAVEDGCQNQRLVYIPDLFASIMASEPLVNLHYHKVKKQADAWIARTIGADEKWNRRNVRVDLAYLASVWAPSCDKQALRVMVDWNHWVFLFDDQFDEGHLMSDLIAAQEEVENTLAIMEDTGAPVRAEDNTIRYVFQKTWDSMKRGASSDLKKRWREIHRRFFQGLITQVNDTINSRSFTRDVSEYMDMRRGTIGAYPAIAVTEYALGIHLPNDVFDHPSLQECMCIASDLVILVNDLLSYKKDLALNVDHNLITLLRAKGYSIQEAVDEIGNMINNCYQRWYLALANMPIWGEHIDREVLKFVEICRNVALGNLYWSFKTGRYLGPEGDMVGMTRKLHLPA